MVWRAGLLSCVALDCAFVALARCCLRIRRASSDGSSCVPGGTRLRTCQTPACAPVLAVRLVLGLAALPIFLSELGDRNLSPLPCLSDLDGHRPTRLGLVCVSRSLKRSVHSVHWCGEPPPGPKGSPPSGRSTIPRARREFVGVPRREIFRRSRRPTHLPGGFRPGGFSGAGVGPIPLSHARRFRGGPLSGAHSTPPTRCPGWTTSVLCVLGEVASST